jgi:glutaredoxin 3
LAIKLYSTPTCSFCQKAKGFLAEHNISYENIDVSADKGAAITLIEKTGQTGVPVLEIGETVVLGFDKEKIRSALGIK